MTKLTEEYGFQKMLEQQGGEGIPLYAISRDNIVYPFAEDRTFKAGPGWQVANLVKPADDAATPEATAAERAKSHLQKETPPKLPD
jgi:hypothetical protein